MARDKEMVWLLAKLAIQQPLQGGLLPPGILGLERFKHVVFLDAVLLVDVVAWHDGFQIDRRRVVGLSLSLSMMGLAWLRGGWRCQGAASWWWSGGSFRRRAIVGGSIGG